MMDNFSLFYRQLVGLVTPLCTSESSFNAILLSERALHAFTDSHFIPEIEHWRFLHLVAGQQEMLFVGGVSVQGQYSKALELLWF